MKDNDNLVDPWRLQHPTLRRYTWRQPTPLKQSRLDFFLISEELTTFLSSSNIVPGYRTDHSLISLDLDLSSIKRGKGFWKFNNSLLKDSEYIKCIKDKILDVRRQYAVSPYNLDNIDQISHVNLSLQ